MKRYHLYTYCLLLLLPATTSSKQYHIVQHQHKVYKVSTNDGADSNYANMLQLYKLAMDLQMNVVDRGIQILCCTMGNHDFDAGVEGFANQLHLMGFPMLTVSYNFAATALEYKTQPYTVIKKGGLRIGVLGPEIELKGLASENAYGKTQYLDPLPVAKRTSTMLKQEKKYDMVICLLTWGMAMKTIKQVIW